MTDKQHALLALDLVDGLFQWTCACGVLDSGWWRSRNARESWRSHCQFETRLVPVHSREQARLAVTASGTQAQGDWVEVDDRFDFDHCTCFDTLGPEGYPPPCDDACPRHGAPEARLAARVVAWRPRR